MSANYTITDRFKSGKKFKRLRVAYSNGTRFEKQFKTKALAKSFLRANPQVLVDKTQDDAAAPDAKFKVVAEAYMKMVEKGLDGKKPRERSTTNRYRQQLDSILLPVIGQKKMSTITRKKCQNLLQHCVDVCPARRSARTAFQLFKSIMTYAANENYISMSPATGLAVSLDSRLVEEISIYSRSEMVELQAAFERLASHRLARVRKSWGLQRRVMFYTLISTGMRISEVLGLQFDDFSSDFRTLRIQRRIAQPQKGHKTREDQIGLPKTRHGTRTISIMPDLAAMFLELRRSHNHLWVFCAPSGNFLDYKNVRRDMWVKLLKEANLANYGIHSLRHYYASIMIDAQCNPIELSRNLGHHSVEFTMDTYGHLMPENAERREELVDKVAAALEMPPMTPLLEAPQGTQGSPRA